MNAHSVHQLDKKSKNKTLLCNDWSIIVVQYQGYYTKTFVMLSTS